ncbi:Crp/Fnr family transcriptional regulator [Listeria monocytogenes]|nr:Crp/Fnr family transcriptional regulator [Listeria monocytogenes]EAD4556062.1 Crp/Fnr family transcriptional regulator [Listeria monocytogenes]
MTKPFNHTEFIHMMNQYNFKATKIPIPKHTILNDLLSSNSNCLYLLNTGLLAGYLDVNKKFIYSFFNDNFLLGYFTAFEDLPLNLTFQALTSCEVLCYQKKDVEFAFSLFPENFEFQYSIMKTIAIHGYYRSLMLYREPNSQVAFALATLVKILDLKVIEGIAILPPEICTTIILNYCHISNGYFYSQLKELKEATIISKVHSQWQIDINALASNFPLLLHDKFERNTKIVF